MRERGLKSLAVFGSVIRGEARTDSDIDVLVDVEPDVRFSLIDLVALKDFLEDRLNRKVDVVTKSGTNDWHGTLFGYFRNSVFDARNFNDYNLAGNPAVPPFRMGQYGLTFGGPIVKNKTFFIISYEGLRQLQSITQQFTVP